MTAKFKSLIIIASIMITAGLSTQSVFAQRGGRGGGGGGPRGGGSVHISGGGGGFYRPSFGFGLNFGYRRPYYSYYRPYVGFRLSVLPFGYYPFFFGADQFYYYGGLFYRHYDDGYRVVVPPVGAEVPKLPKGANQVTINGQTFYEYKGVYYSEKVNADGKKIYVVAGKDGVLNTDKAVDNGPQIGDVIDQLPEDCREVMLKDQKYYVSPDDVYYEEVADGNKVTYRVVGKPL